jgi:hypothetical protein
MAINFYTTDVADDSHLLDENGNWNETCRSLSFASEFIGIPKITEKNTELFYKRYLANGFVQSGSFDAYLTLEEVEKSVGFATNASPMTDTQFAKKLSNTVMLRAQAKVNNILFDRTQETS